MPQHLRTDPAAMQVVPEELMAETGEVIPEGESIPPGATIFEGESGDVLFDEPFDHSDHCESCEDGACGGEACGQVCVPCDCCFCLRLPCFRFPHNFYTYGGAHAAKGPINRGSDSSFGFDEEINWGAPLNLFGDGDACGFGGQLGVRGVHSNLSGATGLTLDDRNQLFVTAGLFRRVDCGLQFGAAIDWLHEDWDVRLDLAQVRGEASWVFLSQSEVGFRYTGGVSNDSSDAPAAVAGINWLPVDLYAFFFRQKLAPLGGECQVYAGFSGESEGLLGANATIPLAPHMALAGDFAYLVPETGAATQPIGGAVEESWNVGLGVVFYPGAGFFDPSNYYRPLFDVANNGTMMYDIDD
jgi:hypothetical protein